MLYTHENELGSLSIGFNVIQNVCGRVIDEFNGDILPSDEKGRMGGSVIKLRGVDEGFLKARYDGELLILKFYIIVKFGVSINSIVAELATKVREEMPALTGIKVGRIKIVVVGTLSKNLTKRNIEIVDDDF